MGATDKYQLIVESASRGDAELSRLEQVVNKLADTTERAQKRSADSYTRTSRQAVDALAYQESAFKRMADAAESGGHRVRNSIIAIGAGVVATREIFDALSGSVDKFTAATLRSDAALSRTLATYRATRLVSSAAFGARALLGTAGTIGVGLAVEAVIRNARAQAEKVQAASLVAATTGNSFGGAYALNRASSVTGRDLGFLAGKSTEDIDQYNKTLSKIADPVDRASAAFLEFGKHGAAALDGIDDRLVRQVKRGEELSALLDGPTREGLQRIADTIKNLHPFDDLSDGLKNFLEEGKIGLAKFAVDVARATKRAARDSAGFVNVLGPDAEFSGEKQGIGPTSEKRFRPEPDDLNSRAQFTADARKRLQEQLTNQDTGGFELRSLGSAAMLSSAKSALEAHGNSIHGVQLQLGKAEEALKRYLQLFNGAGESQKASFSEQILRETKTISAFEERIKLLEREKALREKIANQQREFKHDFELYSGKILNSSYKSISGEITDRGAAMREGKNKDLLPGQMSSIGGLFDQREANRAKDADFERVNGLLNEGNSFRNIERGKTAFGVPGVFTSGLGGSAPTLRRAGEGESGVFEMPGVSRGSDSTKGASELLAIQRSNDERDRSRRLQTNQQELSFLSRKLELLTGPGGERAAVEAIAKLKLAALEEEASVSLENFNIRDRQNQIERERIIGLAELDKKRRDAGREAVGRTFDALVAGGSGGVGALVKSVGLSQVRTIAQNAGEKLTTTAGGFLGRIGKASGLGGLLGGTMFDPQNAGEPLKVALDANREALNANTAAQLVRGGGDGTGVVGKFSGLAAGLSGLLRSGPKAFSAPVSITPGSSTSTIAGSSLPGFDALNVTGSFGRDMSQVSSVPGTAKLNASQNFSVQGGDSKVGKAVSYGSAAATAAFGAFNGFKAGGVQGNLSGAASVLGGIALIPGPQQPFVAAAALSLAVIAALIGDPKKNRDKAIDRLVSDSRFTETQPLDYAFDTRGGGFDYNMRGDLRSMPINLTINALDARSIFERGEDIATAVQQAMYSGHSINRAAQEVVLGI